MTWRQYVANPVNESIPYLKLAGSSRFSIPVPAVRPEHLATKSVL